MTDRAWFKDRLHSTRLPEKWMSIVGDYGSMAVGLAFLEELPAMWRTKTTMPDGDQHVTLRAPHVCSKGEHETGLTRHLTIHSADWLGGVSRWGGGLSLDSMSNNR